MNYITDPRTGELWWKRDDGVVCRGVVINIRETSLPDIPFPRTPDPVVAELVEILRSGEYQGVTLKHTNIRFPRLHWRRCKEILSRLEPETKGGQDG